jgi:hypothetical protein
MGGLRAGFVSGMRYVVASNGNGNRRFWVAVIVIVATLIANYAVTQDQVDRNNNKIQALESEVIDLKLYIAGLGNINDRLCGIEASVQDTHDDIIKIKTKLGIE